MKFSCLLLFSFIVIGCTFKKESIILKNPCNQFSCVQGGIIRGDTTQKTLSIVLTGGDYADGGNHIQKVLKSHKVLASFFFTGDFYRNQDFHTLITELKAYGHYMGAHSDTHLLYCDWLKRDSLLVTKFEFLMDLQANYIEMEKFGVMKSDAQFFMPPYEWYNDSISQWTKEAGLQIINFTPGTRSNADYTTPEMSSYRSSDEIYQSIVDFERASSTGLNGFILLIHIGTAPERTDKFYNRLDKLILWIKNEGYELKRIDDLLATE